MATAFAVLIGLIIGGLITGIIVWTNATRATAKLSNENTRLMAEGYAAKRMVSEKIAEMSAYIEEIKMQQNQLYHFHAEKTRLETELAQNQRRIAEKEAEFTRLQKQMQLEFEKSARDIFENNSAKMTANNQEKLDSLLNPLKEKLTQFEKRVEDTYNQEARERFHLQKELASLVQLNHQLSQDANALSKALKGDSKLQGNWGELILIKVLESSGLREGEEFIVQAKDLQLKNETGERQQPDIIIQLPDKRHLIIDAKVSLTAYERYSSADSDIEKRNFLRKHIESITQHVQGLSAKHYESLDGLFSPDFILLFLPLESAFSAAITAKPDLFHFAFERKIVIVSPTTLLATLKTVSSIWKLEHQNRNAAEIARQGGLLYDKFAVFTEELEKVGKNLRNATDSYDKTLHRLTTGRDSLLHRAEKLRELGVKINKQIPQNMNGSIATINESTP